MAYQLGIKLSEVELSVRSGSCRLMCWSNTITVVVLAIVRMLNRLIAACSSLRPVNVSCGILENRSVLGTGKNKRL